MKDAVGSISTEKDERALVRQKAECVPALCPGSNTAWGAVLTGAQPIYWEKELPPSTQHSLDHNPEQ